MYPRILRNLTRLPIRRNIVAAICYRGAGPEFEFLLVRTHCGRWTFPKGGVERGEKPAIAAAREAREEGGVIGVTEPTPFACYRYRKSNARGWLESISVDAYLCRVSETIKSDEEFRQPKWFSPFETKQHLGVDRLPHLADELAAIVDAAVLRARGIRTGT